MLLTVAVINVVLLTSMLVKEKDLVLPHVLIIEQLELSQTYPQTQQRLIIMLTFLLQVAHTTLLLSGMILRLRRLTVVVTWVTYAHILVVLL